MGAVRAADARREDRAAARRSAASSTSATNFVYGVFAPDESRVLGGSGLAPRGWGRVARDRLLDPRRRDRAGPRDRADRGADACRLRAVRRSTASTIQVDPENERSLNVPRKLGFIAGGDAAPAAAAEGGRRPRRDVSVFTMFAEELACSRCVSTSTSPTTPSAARSSPYAHGRCQTRHLKRHDCHSRPGRRARGGHGRASDTAPSVTTVHSGHGAWHRPATGRRRRR